MGPVRGADFGSARSRPSSRAARTSARRRLCGFSPTGLASAAGCRRRAATRRPSRGSRPPPTQRAAAPAAAAPCRRFRSIAGRQSCSAPPQGRSQPSRPTPSTRHSSRRQPSPPGAPSGGTLPPPAPLRWGPLPRTGSLRQCCLATPLGVREGWAARRRARRRTRGRRAGRAASPRLASPRWTPRPRPYRVCRGIGRSPMTSTSPTTVAFWTPTATRTRARSCSPRCQRPTTRAPTSSSSGCPASPRGSL
mmetsp:Transcript_35012/g.104283  ORF Transcript_35012/g.104283 Transcript_35012/m.104283 type:complete len:250 (-) Transcript_35012:207-956(-)